jgi:hypothetical protein
MNPNQRSSGGQPKCNSPAWRALRSVFAALIVGCAIYSHDSSAVLLLITNHDEVEWFVGGQAPSIDIGSDGSFVVLACGAELTWVYENFPTIAQRKLPAAQATLPARSAHRALTVANNACVMWRGNDATFIADNIDM